MRRASQSVDARRSGRNRFHYEIGATAALQGDCDGLVDEKSFSELMVGVLAFARSAGAGSDLVPMEAASCPLPCLKGGRAMGGLAPGAISTVDREAQP